MPNLARKLADNPRLIGMLALLLIAGAAYALFFVLPKFRAQEMVIVHRAQWNTVVFSLDTDYPLTNIEVVSLTPEGERSETMWKVGPADEPPEERTFTYGRAPRGMETVLPPSPLEPGQPYRITIKAKGAKGESDFQFVKTEAPQRPAGGRRQRNNG